MTLYILVSGKAGAGKDYTSDLIYNKLLERGINATMGRSAFATKLKEIAVSMGWDQKKDERGRKLLQEIGETGRNYDKDLWVKTVYDQTRLKKDLVIISDWRYENEYDYLIGKVGTSAVITVRVFSDRAEDLGENAEHVSENALPHSRECYDFAVENFKYDNINLTVDPIVNEICRFF